MKRKWLLLAVFVFIVIGLIMPISVQAKEVKLNKTKATLTVGKTLNLKVTGFNKKIKWKTSNKKIATIKSSGKYRAIVKAKKTGNVIITAKAGKKILKCKISVKKKNPTNGKVLVLFGNKINHENGSCVTIKIDKLEKDTIYTEYINGAAAKTSSIKSSNPSVISVRKINSYKMEFSYNGTGKTVITVVSKGKKYKWTIKVQNSRYKIKREQIYQQLGISNSMKTQYKCFLIAKWMCDNINYDFSHKLGSYSGQTYEEALDKGTAVCGGYTDTYQYLLDGLNIPCKKVVNYRYNTSNVLRHAWNHVLIDGEWYAADIANMDKDFSIETNQGFEGVRYNMTQFLMPDKYNSFYGYPDKDVYELQDGKIIDTPAATSERFVKTIYESLTVYQKQNPDVINYDLRFYDKDGNFNGRVVDFYERDYRCNPWFTGSWVNY